MDFDSDDRILDPWIRFGYKSNQGKIRCVIESAILLCIRIGLGLLKMSVLILRACKFSRNQIDLWRVTSG